MVMEGIQEDMGDGSSMQCTNHPYKNISSPGGICALCLQEKLGKLVSSSFPSSIFPSSSSSSTPSFRSDLGGPGIATSAPTSSMHGHKASECSYNHHPHQFASIRKPRLPFQRRKKKSTSSSSSDASAIVFKRSKSTATPRNRLGFLETDKNGEDNSPRKRGFWSFLYYPSSTSKKFEKTSVKDASFSSPSASVSGSVGVREKKRDSFVVVEENEESSDQTAPAQHDRKVSRSRSVGCGSRSFSGDFFERISTGFGDCTLRRVESQREGKPKIQSVHHRNSVASSGQDCIRERVKCGGIFSGFMMISASSSSSSDWVSSEENGNGNGKPTPSSSAVHHHQLAHGRIKTWGWALASPMRAFSKTSSGKTDASNKNPSPNLDSIPSLLTVRS